MQPRSNPSPAPLRVVIVGGGTAGWMCAAGLARLLPPTDYALTLIESDEIGTVGVGEATLPHIREFNAMLGLDEAEFMRATQGSFKLGIEFVGWDKPGGRYVHPFGSFGERWGGIDFQHHWLRARAAGQDVGDWFDHSFAVAMCREGVFDLPDEDLRSIRSTFSYAYHFDAGLYAEYLRRWATPRGVRRIEGKIVDIARNAESGLVESVALQSGAAIAGDLFIDCSGFRSLLLGQSMGVAWHDWSAWLPCDRAMAVPCAGAAGITPFTRSTAQAGGWTWRIPLQHRTGNGYVFSSSFCSEEQARETILGAIDGAPLADPRLLRFQAGRRARGWEGNVVAIGLSSGFLEPLESTSIFLIQAAVTDLANLMPLPGGGPPDPRLAAEFNRLFAIHYDRTRDFLVLHYTANARHGEPLWDHVRNMALPDSLAHKIALFRSSGRAPDYKLGLFSRDSWLAVLMGQGILPEAHDRLADRAPLDEVADRLAELRERIATNAAALPAHAEFIASYCSAARGTADDRAVTA
ncbi:MULTISPECIES: tryptophan halogenase family protein [Sphingomonas]|uniref:Tryptophan halogenase n=1 Tax=Sphingomonas leidyi TaxID=68569 RepID=A0A7X5ZTZ6_9SPHN|nr:MULTISPECIES: tryptophan halogenase family protein [Sphingomonas]MBN8813415.1 tryptophan 7-halogenase [Sphingomonas sp.]NIJ63551.1 tryptophan halogenase [Sphingomonas leidyi]OJY52919.1 MAG: tryptophan halogenase [Sphingomonas sp. 67-41]